MDHMITASGQYQKEANRNLIMNELRRQGTLSRADLARITGLKRSTITHIVQELIDCSLIREGSTGSASPQGGRRPIALQIDRHFGYIIGIDIDRYTCEAVLMDITGGLADHCTVPVPYPAEAAQIYIPAVITAVYEKLRRAPDGTERPIIAIGLGISGTVDPKAGIIMESRLHAVKDLQLSSHLAHIPVPILIENDANCGAWAEIMLSEREDPSLNGIYVLPRISHTREGRAEHVEIGGAVITQGAVWHGSRFITGEFSMRSWFEPGIEQIDLHREQLLKIEEDPEILMRWVSVVLSKLVTVARMLDPDIILLAGIFATHPELVQQVIEEQFHHSWYHEADHADRVVPSSHVQHIVAIGAGAYVLSNIFSMQHVGDPVTPFDISWEHVVLSGRRNG